MMNVQWAPTGWISSTATGIGAKRGLPYTLATISAFRRRTYKINN